MTRHLSEFGNWKKAISHVKPFMCEFDRDSWPEEIHGKAKRYLLADKRRILLIRWLCCTIFDDEKKEKRKQDLIAFFLLQSDMDFYLDTLKMTLGWFLDCLDMDKYLGKRSYLITPTRKNFKTIYSKTRGKYESDMLKIVAFYKAMWPRKR